MPTWKITGDEFEDFAPIVHALWEDGMLRTAHLGDDDKDWVVTTDADVDKVAVQGVVDAIDPEGEVKIIGAGDDEDDDVEDDREDDDPVDDAR